MIQLTFAIFVLLVLLAIPRGFRLPALTSAIILFLVWLWY